MVAIIKKHSLTLNLLKVVFSVYIMITAILTIGQMLYFYRTTGEQVAEQLDQIFFMVNNSLEEAVWNYNLSQVGSIIQGLDENHIISSVNLRITDGSLVFGEELKLRDLYIVKNYEIIKQIRDETRKIAELEIGVSHNIIFKLVKDEYFAIVINAIFKTIALWFFFLLFGYRYLTKPLSALINSINSSVKDIALPKQIQIDQETGAITEIRELIDDFNLMIETLKHEHDLVEQVLEYLPQAVIITDFNFNILKNNNKALNLMSDNTLINIFQKMQLASRIEKELKQSILTLKHYKVENVDGGNNKQYSIDILPIPSISRILLLINDVTNENVVIKNMVQNEKILVLGNMVGGIAHELGGPLGVIAHSLNNIERIFQPDRPSNIKACDNLGISMNGISEYLQAREFQKFFDMAYNVTSNISMKLHDMTSYLNLEQNTNIKVDIHKIIDKALSILSVDYRFKKEVASGKLVINKNYEYRLPEVFSYGSQLEQSVVIITKYLLANVFANELTNYKLEISTKLIDEFAVIEFVNNGYAITDSIIDEIFEPKYSIVDESTQELFDMSIAYSIIKRLNGTMIINSDLGKGNKLTIKLPISKNQP